MGYNGNNRKPYNVWKPSLFKRGLRMMVPKPRKSRKYSGRQTKATRFYSTSTEYDYTNQKIMPASEDCELSEEQIDQIKEANKNADIGCLIAFVVMIALLGFIAFLFGWEWAIIIPTIFIVFLVIQD